MTYDDAGWHSDTIAELGLPEEAAATHIGMFYAWARARGLASGTHLEHGVDGEVPDESLPLLDERTLTPGAYLDEYLDGQLDPSFFTAEGCAFVEAEYDAYLEAYERIPAVTSGENMYAAPDTWLLYNAVEPVLDELYAAWRDRR
ncbi:hypothetical protein HWD35_13225 [Tsukamurella tyrosinosolvens]|uniref:DUF7832 domain-containing protein n=1 Tax=Tsukamurella tyrosinosolvens TaxID=57704 RepID=A0A1H4XPB3_TSUTY|nr:hypothetical protein [Tsukamurella tyrosinosolvens]KXO99889.1 hypothetical protein AXK58_01400 [Tsukamurella tyrosinosolvens]KXP04467.1 hypothetical protein AXK59_13680 [Tsukamurella tyrosinosolvens]KZL97706.1 hypothetical protein AXX05_01800 [Tsukamurella tyrosinosolvens]MCA4995672.1 hypothetical protein [Tsukamurella tyrosinosolvens]MEC4615072.1 hypothetical protein [Tsukamurella tyrosinosolvens]